MEIDTLIREKMRSYRVINAMLAMGSAMYGFVMVYIYLYAPIPPVYTDAETITTIEYALIALALGGVFVGKTVREKMLASPSIFKETEATRRLPDQPSFLSNYLSMLFVVWTVFETISVAGIVYFLVTGKIEVALGLVGTAVLLKLFNGPHYEELRELAERFSASEEQR